MESKNNTILVVDDDLFVRESLESMLLEQGFNVVTAAEHDQAARILEEAAESNDHFDVLLTDMNLPGNRSGLDLIKMVVQLKSGTVPIVITGFGSIDGAVEAMRWGAIDYLVKPVVDRELLSAVTRAISRHALGTPVTRGRDARNAPGTMILGDNPGMQEILSQVDAVASTRTTVLMTGQSGTGKSLVARSIHEKSDRRDGPFVELACGSIPETLLESELFGHAKGAFTGAYVHKEGRFMAAEGGTIFLDEINSASPAMQLKLLRVLQERSFEPVGSTETRRVDVRVLLASNQPLEQMVMEGQFRQDLYYRINVMPISLPPLSERAGDIPSLAAHFLQQHAVELDRQIIGFSNEAMDALVSYGYPGNIRELQNIVERAAVLSEGTIIGPELLPKHVRTTDTSPTAPGSSHLQLAGELEHDDVLPLSIALKEPERRIIEHALQINNWNRQKTADQLQINRTTLYKKMRAHGLDGLEEAS